MFTAEDFAHTSSPSRTVSAVVDLLRHIEGIDGHAITREDRVSGFGLIVKFSPAGEPWLHGEKLRILCYEGSPIEIYDTGRRHGTKLSLTRARRKIESNGFRY